MWMLNPINSGVILKALNVSWKLDLIKYVQMTYFISKPSNYTIYEFAILVFNTEIKKKFLFKKMKSKI